jgi:hypothetical protein
MLYEGRLQSSWTQLYYSESELCGSAVTVSFSKYIPWQATHFLQRSTHFSKTCCRYRWSLRNFLPLSSLFMVGEAQKSHGTRSGLYGGCSNGVLQTIRIVTLESTVTELWHKKPLLTFVATDWTEIPVPLFILAALSVLCLDRGRLLYFSGGKWKRDCRGVL